MKISVIIPVFNTEAYLRRCLDSVVNQTCSNLEIILINDGSTDNSLSIIREYEKADSRIIVIDQTNAGQSKARNVALDMMTGDYLSFVDSDDYIDTNTFENVMSMIVSSSEDVDMIAFPSDYVYGNDNFKLYHFLSTDSFIEKYDPKLSKKILLGVSSPYEIWGKVFKSSIFQNIRFPEGRIYEDVWVFPDIDKQLKIIGYSAIGKYYYQAREGSTMSINTLANLKLRLETMRCFFDYLYAQNNLSISRETAKIEFYFMRGVYLIEDKCFKRGWKYYYYFFKFMTKRKASRFNLMGILMFFSAYFSYILIKISKKLGIYDSLKSFRDGHAKLYCPVCDKKVNAFLKLSDYYDNMLDKYESIHSMDSMETLNRKAYHCPHCDVTDRDRLYALYLNKKFHTLAKKEYTFLDIAPNKSFTEFIKKYDFIQYRSADLYMEDVDDRVDITDMNIYSGNSFDIILCSHVLEHIEDDRKAMSELYRILKPAGFAIVMVPINLYLTEDFENPEYKTEAERWKYFGQNDHVRLYSKNGFVDKLAQTGFKINQLGVDYFGKDVFEKCGIHLCSVLYIVEK